MTDPVLVCRGVTRDFSEGGSLLQVLRGEVVPAGPGDEPPN